MGHPSRPCFDRLLPVSDRYAGLPVAEAFTWDACADEVEPGEWYMVAFRSTRRPDADEARLRAYDDWAHAEAMEASGFVHYFKGPTTIGRPVPVVLPVGQPGRGPRGGGAAGAPAGRRAHPRGLRRLHPRVPSRPPRRGRSRVHLRAVGRRPRVEREPAQAEAHATPRAVLTHGTTARGSVRSIAPGLAAAIAVAAVARLVTSFLPSIVADVTVALLLGIIVAAIAGPRLAPLDGRASRSPPNASCASASSCSAPGSASARSRGSACRPPA